METISKSEGTEGGISAVQANACPISSETQENKSLSDARPERGGSSDLNGFVVMGTAIHVTGGMEQLSTMPLSHTPSHTGSETAEQIVSAKSAITVAICSHPESRRQNIQQAYARGICPDCGAPLRFGSRDPCEGDYYWCSGCGDGPILFPLYHVMPRPVAPVIDAEKANAALVMVQRIRGRAA